MELIGNPVLAQKSSGPSSSSGDQPGRVNASLQSFGTSSVHGGMVGNQNMSVAFVHSPEINRSHDTSPSRNYGSGRFAPTNAPPFYLLVEAAARSPGSVPSSGLYAKQNAGLRNPRSETPQPHMGGYSCPPQSAYQQPSPMYSNRGSVARKEALPRIVPIIALNPYHGRWTLEARAMTKAELGHYNNTRGDGKAFSFDLLDCDGGEIRATCSNQVADQFYNQIEARRIYFLPPALVFPGGLKVFLYPKPHSRCYYSASISNSLRLFRHPSLALR